jgi:hypothetical protein
MGLTECFNTQKPRHLEASLLLLVAVTTYYMIETHALLALFQTHTPFVPE